MPPCQPCAGVSAAARRFLASAGEAAAVDLSPQGVAELRSNNSEAAAAGCLHFRKCEHEKGGAIS